MVGFEFSRFRHHVPKKTPTRLKKGSENGVKMDPRSGKRVPGAHFVSYESFGSEKCPKEVMRDAPRRSGTLRDAPGRAESRVWVPLIKETSESQALMSGIVLDVRDRIRHYKKAPGA